MTLDYIDILLKLLVAAILGSIIGLERNIHGRPAGLRTHLLVSLGAANFVILSELISSIPPEIIGDKHFFTDPSRIAAQVVTGIGFLGAGVIIKDGLSVRGLTTAASLWVSASIGMASGAGYYLIGIMTTIIALTGLILFQYIEKLYSRDSFYYLVLNIPNKTNIKELPNYIKHPSIVSFNYDFEKNYETDSCKVKFSINVKKKRNSEKIILEVINQIESSSKEIKSLKWYRA